MDTRFCPVCGRENPAAAATCAGCGSPTDARILPDAVPDPPLQLGWLGAFAGGAGALLALTHLVEPLKRLGFVLAVQRIDWMDPPLERAVAHGGMARLLWAFAWVFLAAAAVAGISRRRLIREVALGGLLLVALQALLWLHGLEWRLGLLGSGYLHVLREGYAMAMPTPFFVLSSLVLLFLSALGGHAAGQAALELATGTALCPACGQRHPIRPSPPLLCPHCRAPLARSRVAWRFVGLAVLGTALAFALGLKLAGPPLGFYQRCTPYAMTERCEEMVADYNAAGADERKSWMVFGELHGRDSKRRSYLILLHEWKYLGCMAVVFFFAPFGLGWRLRRKALASAGAAIPLGWLAATLVALIGFGFAGFEGAFFAALQLHVLGLVIWSVVGFAGAMLGYRLGSRSEDALLAELDD